MAEKIGSGRRFRALEGKLASRPGVNNPAALAAAIGRKKLGAARMAALAQAGKRRAERERATGQQPQHSAPVRRIRV
jgi:hypothetical protein